MNKTATHKSTDALASRRNRQLKHIMGRLVHSFAMFRNPKSITGLCIMLFFALIAIFAPIIAPYDPLQKDYTALLQPPSGKHWLGTTHMGEDVFS